MMKTNTKNFWVLTLLITLLMVVVLTSGCVENIIGGDPPKLVILPG